MQHRPGIDDALHSVRVELVPGRVSHLLSEPVVDRIDLRQAVPAGEVVDETFREVTNPFVATGGVGHQLHAVDELLQAGQPREQSLRVERTADAVRLSSRNQTSQLLA